MEENKNNEQQNGGGRHRRRHGRHGHGGNGGNGGNKPAQAQAQTPSQPQNGGHKPQNQAQNQGQGKPQNGQRPQNQGQFQGNRQDKNRGGNVQNGQSQKNKQPQQKNQNKGGKGQGNKEENRKDTYLYTLDGKLYVNLTNKCSNGCDFCVRNERTSYYGNYLWLKNGEPTAEKVIAAANGYGDLSRFEEVVFCGFGEPTYRTAEMLTLCEYFHEKGLKTRLNTNGQGNLINKRDIVPELKGKLDFVNVSLNASCYEKYQPMCRSQFKEAGFAGLVDFAKSCRGNGIDCRFSIVDCIGEEEIEACKKLAQSVNVPLYIRSYITDS